MADKSRPFRGYFGLSIAALLATCPGVPWIMAILAILKPDKNLVQRLNADC